MNPVNRDPLARLLQGSAPSDETAATAKNSAAEGDSDRERDTRGESPSRQVKRTQSESPSEIETEESDSPLSPLERLATVIEPAQAFAERWPAPYRLDVFRLAIGELLRGQRDDHRSAVEPIRSPERSSNSGALSSTSGPIQRIAVAPTGLTPVEKLGRALGVDGQSVERAVSITDAGAVAILGRLLGKTKKELQTRYSLVYLYVKEIALGNRMVDIEELRTLCIDQGCYDLGNFTGNFKKDVQAGLLREQSDKGSRARRYMLSQKGLVEAAGYLRSLVDQ